MGVGTLSGRVVEASAPACVHLAGGALDRLPPAELSAVAVAIDRRASCRVETGGEGVRVESKDTLQRADVPDVSRLAGTGVPGLVSVVLRELGIEAGVRVTTQARAPGDSALGVSPALAVAVVAAASRAFARNVAIEDLVRIAREAEARSLGRAAGRMAALVALHGGVLGARLGDPPARHERLAVDPGLVEEALSLVRAGAPGTDEVAGPSEKAPTDSALMSVITSAAARVRQALVAGRALDVVGPAAEEWDAWLRLDPGAATPRVARIAEIARGAGGAALAASLARDLVAVWAPPWPRGPGPRERVVSALEAEGFRALPVRVDLLGLAVQG